MNTTHASKPGQESVVEGRLVEPWLGPQSRSYSPCMETPPWQAQPAKPYIFQDMQATIHLPIP